MTASLLTFASNAYATDGLSYSLDDNGRFPIGVDDSGMAVPLSFIGGFGAEKPGTASLLVPSGLVPSPTIGTLSTSDGALLHSPGGVPAVQTNSIGLVPGSLGSKSSIGFMSAMSRNLGPLDTGDPIKLYFSVDRLSPGDSSAILSNDVSIQAGVFQQSSDIFVSTATFGSPGTIGALFADSPPSNFQSGFPVGGSPSAGSNSLFIDEGSGTALGGFSPLGLTTGAGVIGDPPADSPAPTGPIPFTFGPGSHDNVDGLSFTDFGIDSTSGGLEERLYFSIYYNEVLAEGLLFENVCASV